ncbi:MAG: 5-methyltetrahydropteroyltriglutamate--homocysteine S-methyltransferase [Gemmatimonadaceae bacterium]
MAIATNLGFPRIGQARELKRALEDHWGGRSTAAELMDVARSLRLRHWELQSRRRIEHVPSNDFSLYDHVLDTAVMVGAIPSRFDELDELDDVARYFAMARGLTGHEATVPAMEMTKWFDTNYHYIVPEFERGQEFRLNSKKPIDEFIEAKVAGIITRPVLLGPISLLLLGKSRDDAVEPISLLPQIIPVYEQLLQRLKLEGASWVQIDEPCLIGVRDVSILDLYARTYERLGAAGPKVLVATYFGDLGDNLSAALDLPVAALHIDLVRAPSQLARALESIPPRLSLSLGVVDGRNIWRADLDTAFRLVDQAARKLGPDRTLVAPSCSLLHVPIDLTGETDIDGGLLEWLAFAKQKLREVALLAEAVSGSEDRPSVYRQAFIEARHAMKRRRNSPRIHDADVRHREGNVTEEMAQRTTPYQKRREIQAAALNLPLLPTTTIGSFPQTAEIRRARSDHRAGRMTDDQYETFLRAKITETIRFQEEVGLDVLVHGEFERNDMVEYFATQLKGFAFTRNGWVQSYGSRCVKPPIIYGDVSRPEAMTVAWSQYAQTLTERPVKGMLTGPVTMLQWSFVRDDQPRALTCRQLALAIRDEVADLEKAGIRVIQIDEPAIREGLPLRREEWAEYLRWAVDAFRLASSGVRDETQIHTHMCYSEFDDIIAAVSEMDADVLSIETSRSDMELLETFGRTGYPNSVGPGVYDVHSPGIPSVKNISALLRKALAVLEPQQLWVNPDCGLKTRRWEEVRPAIDAMVVAASRIRHELAAQASDYCESSADEMASNLLVAESQGARA